MFRSVQFESDRGLGKIAVAAFGLGFTMALHLALLAYTYFGPLSTPSADSVLSVARWECVALWCLYAVALSFFHVSEFMVTASFRPGIVSYECAFAYCLA